MPGLLLHTSGESFWSMARKGLNETGMVVEKGRSNLIACLSYIFPPQAVPANTNDVIRKCSPST